MHDMALGARLLYQNQIKPVLIRSLSNLVYGVFEELRPKEAQFRFRYPQGKEPSKDAVRSEITLLDLYSTLSFKDVQVSRGTHSRRSFTTDSNVLPEGPFRDDVINAEILAYSVICLSISVCLRCSPLPLLPFATKMGYSLKTQNLIGGCLSVYLKVPYITLLKA